MWVYRQATGELLRYGLVVGRGYSGFGEGKNNPAMEQVENVGPIPRGLYTRGDPIDSPTHGPHAIPLTPDPSNEMFGRSEFLMHGDSIDHPGEASRGCIIQGIVARTQFGASDDKTLEVV